MDTIESFKNNLTTGKNQPSKATLKNYLADLRQFSRWIEQKGMPFDPGLISNDLITQYLQEKGAQSPRSAKRYASTLRRYFALMRQEGKIIHDPFTKLSQEEHKQPSDIWHIKDFKNYLYVYNSSAQTIKNYINDIKQFTSWIANNALFSNIYTSVNILSLINSEVLNSYKTYLQDGLGLSPISINRKLSSLRKYLSFAHEQGLLKADFTALSNLPKQDTVSELPSQSQTLPQQTQEASIVVPQPTVVTRTQSKKYSSFPPLRLIQKLSVVGMIVFDATIIASVAKILEHAQYLSWLASGKQVFVKSAKNLSAHADKLNRGFKAENLRFKSDFLSKVKNDKVQKTLSRFHPAHPQFASLPASHRLLGHTRHTRPNWYKRYHSYPVVHYFHFAALIILMSGLGFGLYKSFVLDPQSQEAQAALPTAPPRILSFQGRLTDANANPITSATDLRFAIYNDDTASGSALLWQETQYTTPDGDGIFSLLLGTATSIPSTLFAENNDLYLGITVEQDPELQPRQQLATVAFAANAETLQGLPPITAVGAGQTNVVLALDSSGDLTIGGSATPTFSATGGEFTISGNVLSLTTTAGSNADVNIQPDGIGKIDLLKPLQNTSLNNNIPSAAGAVEVNDLFAVLATSSGQSAFTLNQNDTGPLISASASGVARFTVGNDGSGIFAGDLTIQGGDVIGANGARIDIGEATSGDLEVTGDLLPATDGAYDLGSTAKSWKDLFVTGQICFDDTDCATSWATVGVNYWQLNSGALSPANSTFDLLVGGNATSSASWQVFALGANQGTASSSGQLTFRGPTDPKINVLNGENFGIRTSPGGDAGLTERFTVLNSGNVGIGSTTPRAKLNISGTAQSPDLSSNTGLFAISPTTTQELVIGGDPNSPFGMWIQTKRTSSDGTSWPLALNPLGGNVGIGTLNPTFKLDVSGTGRFTGNLDATSGLDVTGANLTVGGANFSVAQATGNITTAGDLALNGGDLTSTGDLTINPAGGQLFLADTVTIAIGGHAGAAYNVISNAGGTPTNPNVDSDNDLYVQGDVDIGGTLYVGGTQITAGTQSKWQRNLGALAPLNITDDVLIGGTATASALIRLPGLTNQNAFFNLGTGNLGIGTTAPVGKLESRATTEQLRLSYDGSNRTSFTVSSGGDLTIAPTGGDSNITGTLDVSGNSAFGAFASVSTTDVMQIVEAFTNTSGLLYGVNSFVSNAPGAASSATLYAIEGQAVLQLGQNNTGLIAGLQGVASHAGTGTASNMSALETNIGVSSTGTITTARGIRVNNPTVGSGTITTNYGIHVVDQTAGTSDYGIAIEGADTQALWISSAANNTDVANGIAFGSSRDTNLYRSAADTLRTDDNFITNLDLTVSGGDITGANGAAIDIGEATSGDIEITGDLLPSVDATYDLGSTAKSWRDIYLTGQLCFDDTDCMSGSGGYWQRLAGNLSPLTANDTISATTSAAVALTLTQTGAFDALLVQDEAGDSSPFVINQSGNTGIGTTSPTQKLDVRGNVFVQTSAGNLSIDDGGASGVDINSSGYLNLGAGTTSGITFNYNNGTEGFRLHSTGNVGIGEAAPGSKLAVSGNMTIGSGYDTTAAPTNGLIVEGNVGIGTTNAQRKLTVQSDSISELTIAAFYNANTTNNNGAVFSFRGNTSGVGAASFVEFGAISGEFVEHDNTTAQGDLVFKTRGSGSTTEKFRVTGTGNVGIGSTTPGTKLDVTGDIRSSTQFLGNASDTVSAPSFSWSGDTDTGIWRPTTDNIAFSTAGTERIRILANGNVGIGDSTPSQLFVVGSGDPFQVNSTGDTKAPTLALGTAAIAPTDRLISATTSQAISNASTYNTVLTTTKTGTLTGNVNSFGLYNATTINATDDQFIHTVYGNYNTTSLSNGNTADTMYGTYSLLTNNSTTLSPDQSRTATTSAAVLGYALNNAAGTLTSAYGTWGQVINNTTGTITTARGLYGNVRNDDGIMTNGYGVYGFANQFEAGGTLSNAYGGFFNVTQTAGTITNGYGVYIAAIDGSTNYGLYQSSASNQNYFAGNLGIGDTTPDAPLDVVGDVYISDGLSLFETEVSDGTVEATKFCVGDGETNCATDFASVGTNYWQRLAGNLSPINLNDTISATTSAATALTITQTGAFDALLIQDEVGDSSPFVINQDGNVGVGVSSPTDPLYVSRSGNGVRTRLRLSVTGSGTDQDSLLTFSDEGEGKHWSIGADDSSDVFRLSNGADLDTNTRLLINSTGNVGIGTTDPLGALHIEETTNSKGAVIINGDGNQTLLTASSSGTTRFIVDKTGNVGIGTTTPGQELDVNGDILVAGGGTIDTRAAGTLTIGGTTQTDLTLGRVGAATTINGSSLTVGPTSWTATPTISGLITATSGLTSNGTLTVSNGQTLTAAGVITLGDGGDNFSINSNALDVSTAGAISGVTGFTQASGAFAFSGAGNFSVDSSSFDVTTAGAVSGVTTLSLSGQITDSDSEVVINDTVLPATNDTFNLGSAASIWNDVYVDRICFDGGSDCVTNSTIGGYWQRIAGNLSPVNTNDTISATTSAAVALTLTQTGAFDALLVQDEASDTTPFVINQDGNVGVGDATPTFKLDVTGTGRFTGNLDAESGLDVTGANLTVGGANFSVTTGGAITAAGNLDINGTSSDIAGTLNLSGSTLTSTSTLTFVNATTGLSITTDGVITDIDDANVQIGENLSVTGDLTLTGGDITGANGAAIDIGELTSGDITFTGDLIIADTAFVGLGASGGRLVFNGASTPDEIDVQSATLDLNTNLITNIGNAGTDFTSTGGLTLAGDLDVNGTSNDIAGTLNLSGNTLTSTGDLTLNPGGGQVLFADTDTLAIGGHAGAAYNAISNSGGTPTNPNVTADNDLYVQGDVDIGGTLYLGGQEVLAGGGYWQRLAGNLSPLTANDTISATTSAAVALTLTQTGAFNALLVQDEAGDTTPFVIDQGGNVGIGTTSPGQELDVNGDILVAGGGTIDTRAAGTLTIGGTTQTGLTLGRAGAATTINGSGLTVGPTAWTATPTISGLITATSGLTSNGNVTVTNGNTFSVQNGINNDQILLGYTGANYQHAIKTTHNGGVASGNQIRFYLWTPADAVGTIGTLLAAQVTGNGQFQLPVTGSSAGLLLGGDANLYRSAANVLTTDDAFSAAGVLQAGGTGTVAYNRLGTATTTHASAISANNDLLVSGDAEIDGDLYIDGNIIGGGTISGFWQRNSQALSPTNITDDVLLGGTATASAKIRLGGTTNADSFFNTGGNLGIGTTSPGALLAVAGDTFIQGTTKEYFSGQETRTYRNVAQYNNDTAGPTGTLKIALPTSKNNSLTMQVIKITGYNYVDNGGAWEVIVSGYNHTTSNWVNTSAEIRGSAPFTSVRLGTDGTTDVILLGDTTTVWNYPQIFIDTVHAGYSNEDGFEDTWTISMITDETGITVEKTPTIKMYVNTAGNVGIGTVSPSQKLDVAGNIRLQANGTFDTNAAGTLGIGTATQTGLTLGRAGAATTINGSSLTVGPTSWTATPTISGVVTMTAGFDSNAASTVTNLTIDGTSGTALNISNAGITTDINLQNSETIDNNTDGTINLTATTVQASGNLSVTGTTGITATGIGSGLTFSGTGTHSISASSGTLSLGALTLAGQVTVAQDMDIIPATTTGTNDLGSSSNIWDNLYIDQICFDGGVDCASSTTGFGTNYWNRVAGNIYPLTANDTLSATSSAGVVATFTGTRTGSGAIFLVEDQASDTTPFMIDNNGNVGIGTTGTSVATLTVLGTGYFQGDLTSVSDLIVDGGNVNFGAATIIGDGGDAITLNSNGTLTVDDTTLAFSDAGTITTGGTNTALTLDPTGTGAINFHSTSNTIDSSGNLTIAGNLDINGTSNDIAGTLNLSGNTLTSSSNLTINATGYTRIGDTGTPGSANGDDDLYVEGDLEVDGTIFGTINPGFTTGSVVFQGPSGFAQDNANFFWDDTNNKLGIGTTTPGANLDVNGTLLARGDTAVASFSAIASQYNNTNIVPNASFEVATDGTTPDNWTLSASGGTNTRTFTEQHEGTYAMDLNVTTAGTGTTNIQSNRIAVEPSRVYNISVWAKVDTACGDGFYLRANWKDQWGNTINASDAFSNSGAVTTSWGFFQGNLTAPSSAYSVRVQVYNHMPTNVCHTYVDQVSFRPQLNGDFAVNGDVLIGATAETIAAAGFTLNDTSLFVAGNAGIEGTLYTDAGLNVNNGVFAVNSSGAITALTGITTTGGYTQSGTGANTFSGATTISSTGTALTLSGAATTAINISNTGVTTDINLQNGESIDNNTDGVINLTATTTQLSGDLAVNGGDITSTGTLTLNAASYTRIGDTGTPLNANGDDDLYVEGDLEIDGTVYFDGPLDSSFTAGSIVFAGVSGVLAEDNSNFFWDDTLNRLGIGTNAPNYTLQVGVASGTSTVATSQFIDVDNSSYYLDPAAVGASDSLLTAGNVGIGTTNAGAWLDVWGEGGVYGASLKDVARLINKDTTATDNAINQSFWANRSGGVLTNVASISAIMTNNGATTYTGALAFSTAGTAAVPTERVRINSAGNVGIGTTGPIAPLDFGPTTGNKLLLYPVTTANSYGFGVQANLLQIFSHSVARVGIGYGSSTSFTETLSVNGGNVGIGSTAPGSKFVISASVDGATAGVANQHLMLYNPNNTNGIGPFLGFTTSTDTTQLGAKIGFIRTNTNSMGDLAFYTKPNTTSGDTTTEKLRITGAGNVGIGTTAPTSRFHVANSGFAAIGKALVTLDQYENADLFTASSSGTTKVRITNGGNLALGETRFDPDGNIHIQSSGSTAKMITLQNTGTGGGTTYILGTDTGSALANQGFVISDSFTSGSGAEFRLDFVAGELDLAVELRLDLDPGTATEAVCHSGDDANTTSVLLFDCSGTPVADYMEMYPMNQDVTLGDIVAIGTKNVYTKDNDKIKQLVKSSSAYDPKVMGVHSNEADAGDFNSIGYNIKDEDNPKPVALAGRVKVKVTSENGTIQPGDMITASSKAGVGMKSTKPGMVVGQALESYTNPDPNQVGMIMVFVKAMWYDPDVYIADSGNFNITGSDEGSFTAWAGAYKFERKAGFSDAVVARLKAGFVSAKELVVDGPANFLGQVTASALNVTGTLQASMINTGSLAVNQVSIAGESLRDYIVRVVNEAGFSNESNVTSPLGEFDRLATNVISPLGEEPIEIEGDITIKKTASSSGNLTVEGDASVSGQLAASGIQAQDATISGTLRANKIIADDIEGLEAKIGTLAATTIINNTNVYNIASESGSSEASGSAAYSSGSLATLTSSAIYTDYASIASLSAALAYVPSLSADFATFQQGLMAFGPSSLSDVSVAGQLSVNGSLIVAENSINVLGATLELQPLRQGNLAFMGGLITIDTDGNMSVSGNATFAKDVTVQGVLAAHVISPVPGSDLIVRLPNDQSSFVIADASGSAKFKVDNKGNVVASGSARFDKIASDIFNVVRGAQADTSLTETVASASAGSAIVTSGQFERTIVSPFVTEDSLIYITPTSNTQGVTPFIARQTADDPETEEIEGSFTIRIPQTVTSNIEINWWVVN